MADSPEHPRHPGPPARPPALGWRLAGWAAALAVLGGVFALYLRPAFMVTLVDQVWSCF